MTQDNVETNTITKPAVANEAKPAVEARPGYKTTEFWLSALALILGLVLASGGIAEGSIAAQIIGGVMAILSQLGYTASRTQVKKIEQK